MLGVGKGTPLALPLASIVKPTFFNFENGRAPRLYLGAGEYIVRARNGAPLNPKNMAQRHLRPVLRKLGIKLGGWHDFRHTFTTLMLREHPLKAVSLAIGHANTKITTEVYQHVNAAEIAGPFTGMSRKLLPKATRCDQVGQSVDAKYLN